jgi:hypothetical protein
MSMNEYRYLQALADTKYYGPNIVFLFHHETTGNGIKYPKLFCK